MVTIMGATGNTGKKITEALLRAGEKVRALGRSESKLAELKRARARRCWLATPMMPRFWRTLFAAPTRFTLWFRLIPVPPIIAPRNIDKVKRSRKQFARAEFDMSPRLPGSKILRANGQAPTTPCEERSRRDDEYRRDDCRLSTLPKCNQTYETGNATQRAAMSTSPTNLLIISVAALLPVICLL